MAEHPRRFCPHLHISMQSGSDNVLARMRRRWGSRRFVDRCRLACEVLDQPALTTDVIVGFPGETGQDFEDTCRVCDEVGFSKIHIFPFSPRRTTPAAIMADQVDPQLKAERCRRLAEVEAGLRKRYYASLVSRELEVLVESPGPTPGNVIGTACRYAPVELPGNQCHVRDFVRAIARQVADDRLLAQPIAI
jgi:threonylcarbamoyladenosine tRNA methylthiotransferase MtaB